MVYGNIPSYNCVKGLDCVIQHAMVKKNKLFNSYVK